MNSLLYDLSEFSIDEIQACWADALMTCNELMHWWPAMMRFKQRRLEDAEAEIGGCRGGDWRMPRRRLEDAEASWTQRARSEHAASTQRARSGDAASTQAPAPPVYFYSVSLPFLPPLEPYIETLLGNYRDERLTMDRHDYTPLHPGRMSIREVRWEA